MNYDDFLHLRYVDELARVFATRAKVNRLLTEARIPAAALPQLDTPIEYWTEVCEQLFMGLVPDGVPRLLKAASRMFPGNDTFRQAAGAFTATLPPLAAAREYAVFLSYASPDRAMVEIIARQLVERSIKPWFDGWDLNPGQKILDIGDVLAVVPSFAVFVGPENIRPWQRLEIGAVLSRAAAAGMPLIPVLLPGAPAINEGPPMLRPFRAVRFESLSDARALDELVWGITQCHSRSEPA